ncbi:hypothetical protein INT43_007668 [Umbelopsis isabellina]|uniref:Ribonuclease P/MRP protein subunit POP5 n=1 Tax=Mortierella isabellina TaxID=91625 RepID=A0A8H7PMN2_MORIS|nr:hypothetical protein INT43_007668 [Umbelopsis isabellina]
MVRFKNRWVLIEVQGEPVLSKADGEYENTHIASLNGGTIHTAVRDAILANYGEYGLGSLLSSFNVKYFSSHTNIGIIRVARDYHQMLLVSLFFMKEINGTPCSITVRHVGGNVKDEDAQRAAIQYDLEVLLRRQRRAEKHGTAAINVAELSRISKDEIMKIES